MKQSRLKGKDDEFRNLQTSITSPSSIFFPKLTSLAASSIPHMTQLQVSKHSPLRWQTIASVSQLAHGRTPPHPPFKNSLLLLMHLGDCFRFLAFYLLTLLYIRILNFFFFKQELLIQVLSILYIHLMFWNQIQQFLAFPVAFYLLVQNSSLLTFFQNIYRSIQCICFTISLSYMPFLIFFKNFFVRHFQT